MAALRAQSLFCEFAMVGVIGAIEFRPECRARQTVRTNEPIPIYSRVFERTEKCLAS